MKRIVRGNDFTMRIPVVKIVEGEKVAFPLPGCTDIVVRLCSAFRRHELTYTIDAKEDNVIVARVEGDRIPLGTYALEVRGKIFGNDWRSNEYEQVAIVDRNADADTELGETDEGENSVEMDTAVVVLPPDRELEALVKEAKVQEIERYDTSDKVNGFKLNGQTFWLDKATRVGLMNSTTIAKGMGNATTDLWLGEVKLTIDCDKVIRLLGGIEMYALECFNVTARHKAEVNDLKTVKEVEAYDVTEGYPKQLEINLDGLDRQ